MPKLTSKPVPDSLGVRTALLTLVALVVATTPGVALASLLTNGSFETGTPDPGIYVNCPPGFCSIPGWLLFGDADYVGTAWVASNGVRSIDLNGLAAPASVGQSFATQPGFIYYVQFDLSGNFDGLPVVKDLRVVAAGQTQDYAFDTTGRSALDMGWQTKSFTFVANSTSTTLIFSSLVSSGGWGPVIDNVIVDQGPMVVPGLSGLAIPLLAGALLAVAACVGRPRIA